MRLIVCALMLAPIVIAQVMPFPGLVFSGSAAPTAQITQASGTLTSNVGTTTALFRGQSFTVNGSSIHVTKITLLSAKAGTPTDNVLVYLYTSTGTGVNAHPDQLVAISSTTIAGATLNTSPFASKDFAFSNVPLAPGKYWIVMTRSSGVADTTNYFTTQSSNSSVYADGGTATSGNGTSWSTESTINDLVFTVWGTTP